MENLLLLTNRAPYDDLINTLANNYHVSVVHYIDSALSIIRSYKQYYIIVIDNISQFGNIETLTSFVRENNSDILAMPIILITSSSSVNNDASYLDDIILDCIEYPCNENLLLKRISNAESAINSLSFQDFAEMLKVLPASIYLKDNKARYIFSSQTWNHLDTSTEKDWSIRGKTDLEIRKDKDNAALALESDLKLIESGVGTSYVIQEHADGLEYLQIIKEPVFYADGSVRGIIALINNVTEQELMKQELRIKSITDQLTGLYNRSYFEEYLHTLIKNPKYPLSIIAADCDCLKLINDTYGHDIGDEYIKMCVTLMKNTLPSASVIFRTGGDEFIVFLNETTKSQTEAYLALMRSQLCHYCVERVRLSVSFGFYTLSDESVSLTDALRYADDEMYSDKSLRGRSRC